MAAHVIHGGQPVAVTEAWHEANSVPWPDLPTLERDQLDAIRVQLLLLSNDRALTDPERARLEAVTHHYNVRNALRFLGGRPHAHFGFDGADQVHGNRITHPCGCELHVVFDHHRARGGQAYDVHPHAPRRVCARHSHLAHDLHALHDRVAQDSVHQGV